MKPPGNGSDVLGLAVENSSVSVQVPAAVLQQYAGFDAAITLIEFEAGGEVEKSLNDPAAGTSLSAAPIEISIQSLTTGTKLDASNLSAPMILRLSDNYSADAKCAFWNVREGRWSPQGLREVKGATGHTCETDHLSLFAAVVNKFACMNHVLFQLEAVSNIFARAGDTTFILWGFLLFNITILLLAVHWDWKDHIGRTWRDADFLTNGEIIRAFKGTGFAISTSFWDTILADASEGVDNARDEVIGQCIGMSCVYFGKSYVGILIFRLYEQLITLKDVFRGNKRCSCRALLSSIATEVIRACCKYSIAASTQISPDVVEAYFEAEDADEEEQKELDDATLANDVEQQKADSPQKPETDGRATLRKQKTTVSQQTAEIITSITKRDCDISSSPGFDLLRRLEVSAHDAPLAFFTTGSFCSRCCLIFCAYQPWLELRLHNLLMPRSHRQLLRILDLSGEFLLAVLWFDASGSSISDETTIDWREVQSCPPQDFITTILVSIIFAFVVKVILFLPVIALQTLHSRAFVALHEGEHSEKSRELARRQLRWWLFKDVLLWIIALTFAAFCSIMVLTFWTNVSWDVQQGFAFICLTYIAQWYLFEPFERAFMCASVGSLIWWAKPDFVRDEITKRESAFTRWLAKEGLADVEPVEMKLQDAIVLQGNPKCSDFVLDMNASTRASTRASTSMSMECAQVVLDVNDELEQGHVLAVRSSSPRPNCLLLGRTDCAEGVGKGKYIRTNRFGTTCNCIDMASIATEWLPEYGDVNVTAMENSDASSV
jgi:hypothetical protein